MDYFLPIVLLVAGCLCRGSPSELVTDVVPSNQDFFSDEFRTEILPAFKETSLLFRFSYLCVAGFPELERLIRAKATDCRYLYSSSNTLLLQGASTSDNMLNTLFPILRKAIEMNKPAIAMKFLEKARLWLHDIIRTVEDMAKKYEQLEEDVGSAARYVVLVKSQTEIKKKELGEKIISMEVEMKRIEVNLSDIKTNIEKNQNNTDQIQQSITNRNKFDNAKCMGSKVCRPPKSSKKVNEPVAQFTVNPSMTRLEQLQTERTSLDEKQQSLEAQLMSLQKALVKAKTELDLVPDTVYLEDIHECLKKIQNILLKLKGNWVKINAVLDNLNTQTFAVQDKMSLEMAQKAWMAFGSSCVTVGGILNVQSTDAYKFLEIDPSSLSKEQWQEAYLWIQKQTLYNGSNPPIDQGQAEYTDKPTTTEIAD